MEVTYAFPRVRVTVPEGWTDESVITLVGPAKDGLAPNIVVTRAPLEGDDWRSVVERELAALRREARGLRVVSRAEVSHAGAPALRVEHTFTSPDRVLVRQVQLYVFRAPWLYTASLSHADREFEASRAGLERVLASLVLGEAS